MRELQTEGVISLKHLANHQLSSYNGRILCLCVCLSACLSVTPSSAFYAARSRSTTPAFNSTGLRHVASTSPSVQPTERVSNATVPLVQLYRLLVSWQSALYRWASSKCRCSATTSRCIKSPAVSSD